MRRTTTLNLLNPLPLFCTNNTPYGRVLNLPYHENSLDSQPPSCDFWGEALSSS